jgi:hypothetical protein
LDGLEDRPKHDDFPGQDIRWLMNERSADCPEWARQPDEPQQPEPARRPSLQLINGEDKDEED